MGTPSLDLLTPIICLLASNRHFSESSQPSQPTTTSPRPVTDFDVPEFGMLGPTRGHYTGHMTKRFELN